jgi:branched-chain amino acid transport system permease protein
MTALTRTLTPRRWVLVALLIVAFAVVPRLGIDYLYDAILLPVLALGLAGIGLNLLTGYAGQISVGSAAFMAVGAFGAYNLMLRAPQLPVLVSFIIAGLIAAVVGILFGLPSLRLKGFYLLVSTLAAQFFVQWVLTNFHWFVNDDPSGVVTAPQILIGGIDVGTPAGRYVLCLAIVLLLAWAAHRLARSQVGRNWIAVRDNETAAAVIGVSVFRSKLLAFAISSFYCGVAGILWAFAYLRTVESDGFSLDLSFRILFIIIIGGLASIRGAFLGAIFLVTLPLVLSRFGAAVFQSTNSGVIELAEMILLGLLIIVLLIAEPDGLVSLIDRGWQRIAARALPRAS